MHVAVTFFNLFNFAKIPKVYPSSEAKNYFRGFHTPILRVYLVAKNERIYLVFSGYAIKDGTEICIWNVDWACGAYDICF